MERTKRVSLLYGRSGMLLYVPADAAVLQSAHGRVLERPGEAIGTALEHPIGSAALSELLRRKKPKTVVITISDITRPVPNKVILPEVLAILNANGVADAAVTIVVGTGMHRPSTDTEKIELVGTDLLKRVRVIDHLPEEPSELLRVRPRGKSRRSMRTRRSWRRTFGL